jgi:uncharacterized cofD-like protein
MSDFLAINPGFKMVAIGGGTGLSTVLSGLKKFVGSSETAGETEPFWLEKLSAIVAVSDDGGSSGRLRHEMQMPPPGDIRNCMVALSEDSHLLSRLFRHRFSGDGELSGHNFGNLFLAALTEITGDFAEAVRLSSGILASKGHIYPATNADVHLSAVLEDGTIVKGETNISRSTQPIRQLKLEPENCDPLPEALAAIQEADIITLGPGSLYTSLLPPLLVKGVADAIGESTAIKIFVCNLMTQPGETDGYTSRQHFETVKEYVPQIDFDFIVMNDRRISDEQSSRYAGEGAFQLGLHGSISPEIIHGVEIINADLLDEGEKVRHSPEKLAQVLLACAAQKFSQVLV